MAHIKGSWSSATYAETRERATSAGSATYAAEARQKMGEGLHPLVDPKTHNTSRSALCLKIMDEIEMLWRLKFGTALPVAYTLDGTGSVGRPNIETAFAAVPKIMKLLVQGANPILRRYHAQLRSGIVQDILDQYPLETSEFEPDNEFDRQLTHLVTELGGDLEPEDYLLAMWYDAFRTHADIWKYKLKGYSFVIGDEEGKPNIPSVLFEKLGVDNQLMRANTVAEAWLAKWHGFFLQIGTKHTATSYWTKLIGAERLIVLPDIKYFPEISALVIGLTEGIFDLQGARDFIQENAQVSAETATSLVRAVAHIPLRTQADLPGFNNIPPAGSLFAKKDDLFPIGWEAPKDQAGRKKPKKKDDITWL